MKAENSSIVYDRSRIHGHGRIFQRGHISLTSSQDLGFGSYGELTILCDNRSCLFSVKHFSSEDQLADFLTKGLLRIKHEYCVISAGLRKLNM